ncbi:unnamed protein product, partial [Mesorhabditis belari]|uniref:LRAT domain-containing protein n=1 Tax=Mesorhabditis belari TaxID=2138241 RepID=A0AAF3FGH6_9BILA
MWSAAVDERLRYSFSGTTACYLGTTALGQRFALAITYKGKSYEIKLVTATSRFSTYEFSESVTVIRDIRDECEAEKWVKSVSRRLETCPLDSLARQPKGWEIRISREALRLERVPNDKYGNLDKVLLPGDELFVACSQFGVRFYHSGVYAGNGLIFHFLSQADERAFSNFDYLPGEVLVSPLEEYLYCLAEDTKNGPPELYRIVHPITVRSSQSIMQECEKLMNNEKFTSYNITSRNCQHFSSLCTYGLAYSYDMSSSLKKSACSLMKRFGGIFFGSYQRLS